MSRRYFVALIVVILAGVAGVGLYTNVSAEDDQVPKSSLADCTTFFRPESNLLNDLLWDGCIRENRSAFGGGQRGKFDTACQGISRGTEYNEGGCLSLKEPGGFYGSVGDDVNTSFWVPPTMYDQDQTPDAETPDSTIRGAGTCGGVKVSYISCDADDNPARVEQSGTWALVELLLGIAAGLVGVIAVGSLVWAGILYSSARDNSQQIEKAKTIIRNTVIGIVAFTLVYAIAQYIIPGGIF